MIKQVPLVQDSSTSGIIERILSSYGAQQQNAQEECQDAVNS
jgi:hypothetical protein